MKQHEEWASERGLSAAEIIPVQIGGHRGLPQGERLFTEGT